MWDIVRLIAHDIILVGGALCILIVLGLLLMWLRISYNRMQTGKAIKQAVQTIIGIVVNPFVAMTAFKELIHEKKEKKHHKKSPNTDKKAANKSKNTKK